VRRHRRPDMFADSSLSSAAHFRRQRQTVHSVAAAAAAAGGESQISLGGGFGGLDNLSGGDAFLNGREGDRGGGGGSVTGSWTYRSVGLSNRFSYSFYVVIRIFACCPSSGLNYN
jgi:hypothetical protein